MSMARQNVCNLIAGAYREKQTWVVGVCWKKKLHSFLNSEPDGDEKKPLSPFWLTTEVITPYYRYLNYIWKFTSYSTLCCLQRKINGLVLFREIIGCML
jgi:hypothetical protein